MCNICFVHVNLPSLFSFRHGHLWKILFQPMKSFWKCSKALNYEYVNKSICLFYWQWSFFFSLYIIYTSWNGPVTAHLIFFYNKKKCKQITSQWHKTFLQYHSWRVENEIRSEAWFIDLFMERSITLEIQK